VELMPQCRTLFPYDYDFWSSVTLTQDIHPTVPGHQCHRGGRQGSRKLPPAVYGFLTQLSLRMTDRFCGRPFKPR
jgi:hypothetical protein